MNMQEFSRQLGREESPSHPSLHSHHAQLFRALRTLSGLDLDRFREAGRMADVWGIWTGSEPSARAERAEPRS